MFVEVHIFNLAGNMLHRPMAGLCRGEAHPKMLVPVTSIDSWPKCPQMSTGWPLAAGPSRISASSSADAFMLGANDDRLQRKEAGIDVNSRLVLAGEAHGETFVKTFTLVGHNTEAIDDGLQ